jgi:prepilin-type N-terminal cleavage/methylation domain-containing protein
MKKAFSLLELVFVIVVIAIISSQFFQNSDDNKLRLAANQVASHIRYTQHLAMMDDKFSSNEQYWYKKRWNIFFTKGNGSNDKWSYVIFSDNHADGDINSYDGNPKPSEVATNPLNMSKKLSGGSSSTAEIHTGDDDATDEMNIGEKFGIDNVSITGGSTGTSAKTLIFDHFGRVYRGATETVTSAYHRLAGSTINITLTKGSESIVVSIEPETGYVRIN